MKSFIITIHHIHNFGSIFQAYALARFLKLNGYDAEIIDYRPNYYNFGRNKFKTIIGKILNLFPYCKRKKKFESFISNHDNLSEKQFHDISELEKSFRHNNDIFIAGGDQLWNDYHHCGKDDSYKLTFTDSPRKIAYGTSMGRDNFSDDALKKLSVLVNGFNKIMLREQSTVAILRKFIRIPIDHVIDPVGLLEVKEFSSLAVKPSIKEPYAVMYLADSGELLNSAIEFLSQKMGLKIVHICGFKKKCFCDYFIKDAGPEEILGYIIHADFVLSASFHATMFSLMFQKQFATLLPGEQTNARINDLLKHVGLENRIVRAEDDLAQLETHIDYTCASQILNDLKEKSRAELLNTLRETTEK